MVCHNTLVVTCDMTYKVPSLSSLHHVTWNPSYVKFAPSWDVFGAECRHGGGRIALTTTTTSLTLSDVNNIVFVAFDFSSVHFGTELALFPSPPFSVSFWGDEESCAFCFNKQTAMWLNKPRGSGCRPARTLSSVSLCLPFLRWGRGAPHPKCTGRLTSHHRNTSVALMHPILFARVHVF